MSGWLLRCRPERCFRRGIVKAGHLCADEIANDCNGREVDCDLYRLSSSIEGIDIGHRADSVDSIGGHGIGHRLA